MNLKEAFRYQNFLNKIGRFAHARLTNKNIYLDIVRNHKRNESNSEATDIEETVEKEFPYGVGELLGFLDDLVCQKQILCCAIAEAKKSDEFNLDAAIETNKFKQEAADALKVMIEQKGYKRKDTGRGYKINAEGNQSLYYYEIEESATEAYDKSEVKAFLKYLVADTDKVSAEIDAFLVNTKVEFYPKYDINDSFEDIMAEYIKSTQGA